MVTVVCGPSHHGDFTLRMDVSLEVPGNTTLQTLSCRSVPLESKAITSNSCSKAANYGLLLGLAPPLLFAGGGTTSGWGGVKG